MSKIFIKTFGCQSNIADSEQLAGILKKEHKILNKLKNSEIVIINTCAVKLPTQNKIINYIKNIPKDKTLIIGGCLTKILDLRKYSNNIKAIFDTNSILKVPKIINKPKDIFSEKKEKRINIPRIRKNKNIAIINICTGCLSNCDYCATKISRGTLKSYKIKEIKKEIKKAIKQGCKIIYLTAQDLGCYGLDINTTLPELLEQIIKIKGNYKLRIGMINPNYAHKYLSQLIKIYRSKKILPFLHIPIQSGSNSLLKKMRRNYKIQHVKKIIEQFRKNIRNITISTDIIVGHPLETKQDFKKTLQLIKQIKPNVLNISKYSKRPKTLASKLKQLPSKEIKKRSKQLTELWNKIKNI